MKLVPGLIVIALVFPLSGCGGPPQDKTETAADDVQETIETSFDKAEGVEDVLQDSADSRNAAIEEATDNN
jgi:hypothetical protein